MGDDLEIERKYLVPAPPPDLDRHEAADIRQGYLALGDDGTEVRLRERGDELTLTVKRGAGRTRLEVEIALGRDAFARLWPLTEGRRVEKRRHLVPAAGVTMEVDVYTGVLEGLVTAEAEFPGEDAAEAFEPPSWCGRELTDDPRYGNRRLAVEGLPA